MSEPRLVAEYGAALGDYLAYPNETSLGRAYEIGRATLGVGAGPLDLAAAHREALAKALEAAGAEDGCVELSRRASDFLLESLVSFEAIERGFLEIAARLRRANEALEQKTGELEAANGELESFSYSVSHDLRAPLRAIDGFSQAVMEDCGDQLPKRGLEHLARVRAAAQRMGELVDGLLSLSRMTRTAMRTGEVDLSALAEEVVEELRRADASRDAETIIHTSLRDVGDAGLLRIVLANLLANSWKFTRHVAHPRIEFGRVEHANEVAYFVRDNGAGFDMAYADKLFGAFQRLHRASEFEGSGIGLATVQRIVHRHGGRVWAEGAVGAGATFYFTLSQGKEKDNVDERAKEHPSG